MGERVSHYYVEMINASHGLAGTTEFIWFKFKWRRSYTSNQA